MAMVDTDGSSLPEVGGGLTAQADWLGLRVSRHLVFSLHSSNEPGELSIETTLAIMTAP